MHAVHVSVHVA